MKAAVLIICALAVIVLGYFLMKQFDKFLDRNCKLLEKENKNKEPACVMLSGNMTDKEIVEEIRRFQQKHGRVKIIISDKLSAEPAKEDEIA